MRLLCVVIACAIVAMASASDLSEPEHFDLSRGEELFEKFIKDFQRVYKDEEDKKNHYEAFLKSLEQINKLNAPGSTARYGINKFADYTDEEKAQMRGIRTKHN